MQNEIINKTKVCELSPCSRITNFYEVTLGYNEEQALNEAKRCLNCKTKPCIKGCPVNVDIPLFINSIAQGKFQQAYEIITKTNGLPAICGRVCPQETQCEELCVRKNKGESVAIGRLERFVADWFMKNNEKHFEKKSEASEDVRILKRKVAIVGSGPAGLTCAADLAKLDYDVTIYEAFHTPGGVLVYGIPEFRLPKELVKKEIDILKQKGVKINTNTVIGKTFSLGELKKQGFDAIFIGSGAGLPMFLGIPGENFNGVYSANEFLTRINLMKAYKFPDCDTPIKVGESVAVVGGGNVAIDAARCAKRLGAKRVTVIYRRSEKELPARLEEVHHAKEEGIEFLLLTNPRCILGNNSAYVNGILCVEMDLGDVDESGRRKPIEKADSEFTLDVQTVIIAIGQRPNPIITSTTIGLDMNKFGGIVIDEESCKTSLDSVYAGGDAVTGAATVILAMGAGKKSAVAINNYLKG